MSGFKAAGGRRGSEVVGCHGEAPTLGGLDRLKDMLGKMKADIEHRIESGMNPITQQLAAYVGQMVTALKKMSAQAPVRIKRIMFNGFCKMGYDFIHASVVHAALFTLPAVADVMVGDQIQIIDIGNNFNTNNLTVGRNSHNINSTAEDLILDIDGVIVTLLYTGVTNGWVITST